ncbi:MAG: hypothetical protein A3K67_01745 [Euryarchaeota archaeon RBG_16_62_10]|nr:MAG: hypothetical protein A3K67_01745 [Euryarchaeota archaeon RBG_16_62_10]
MPPRYAGDRYDMGSRLNKGERLVLFALAEDGNRTDAQVADRVGLKESTARMHRKRLMGEGHVAFVNFPSLHKLGFELIAQFFGHTNPAVTIEDRNCTYREFFRRNPSVFDSVAGESFMMASAAFSDISEFLMFVERRDSFFEDIPWSASFLRTAVFPFDISRCAYLYNFAPCLDRILGLGMRDIRAVSPKPLRRGAPELSKTEAKAFVEMIRSPNATDAEIASRIGRSRQTATEMRNSFLSRGLYTRVAVPTLRSEEFGALAYVHLSFRSGATYERKVRVAGDGWWRHSCYTLERNAELFGVYPFSGFKEYSQLMHSFVGPFQEEGLVASDPEIFVVSHDNLVDLADCEFAPLIGRVVL